MKAIYKASSSSPVDFAAEELKKYLRMMMPEGGDIKISYKPDAKDGFRLGLMADFGLPIKEGEDPELDDVIYVDTDADGGIIAGSNPRATLIAVYEYLRKNGCVWLMPGVDGEIIPIKDTAPVKLRHTPTMRLRGNCIEGAVSQRALGEFIDFMPKLGLNCFMMQFRNPKEFYQRYYKHLRNEQNRPPEEITDEYAIQITRRIECEMDKRGIMLHSVGHGWNNDPFGIDSTLCWSEVDDSMIPEEYRDCFALLDGKRGLYKGRPANTQVCLSSHKVQELTAKCIADYAEAHSNTSYLHVWLADASNNHCECAECAKMSPSDWYIRMMNKTDEELTRRGIDVKIVIIVYVDTSWAPEIERLNNPDRFVLMLAPITRDYTKTLSGDISGVELPPFVRNKLTMPESLDEYLAHLRVWKKSFKNPTFAFEYHFWRHHHYDLSGIRIAERLYEDTKAYLAEGASGIMQCGSQRGFFPNGFAFYTHARAQYDISQSFDELMREYYSRAYGESWEEVRDILSKMYDAVPYDYLAQPHASKRKNAYYDPDMKPRIDSLVPLAEKLQAYAKEHYNSELRARTVLVRLLEHYAEFIKLYSQAFSFKAVGMDGEAMEKYEEARDLLGKREAEYELYNDFVQKTGFLYYALLLNAPEEIDNAAGQ